ncbi:MAG TPA: lysophospholipid acyltransferase family protein [Vicinamibacterales bacterium]|nr:lysophospholipid acyltransferase family protein [Vicinamibacterales bacterium]
MAGVAPVASGFGRTARFRLEALIVGCLVAVVRLLPLPTVRTAGAALGRFVYAIDGFHRRIAMANMAMALPSKSIEERRAAVRGVFSHFGSVLLELIKVGTLTNGEILERIESEGEERIRQAHARGRGVLLFTGHFGYWEVGAIALALRVQPMAVMARPLDNPYLHDMLERIRTRSGNSVIYRQGAIRKVLQELSANRAVAILIDQHLHTPDAVYVDFFSRPAATTNALAALAMRTGAPVIPAFALPLPDGRYRLVYEHAVEPPATDSPDAVREFTQRCTDVLEMYIRRHPELWLWMHRRWRADV